MSAVAYANMSPVVSQCVDLRFFCGTEHTAMNAKVFDKLGGALQDAVMESAYLAQVKVQAAHEAALVNTVGASNPQRPGTIFAKNGTRVADISDAEIKKAGGRTALYMVWPSRARRGDFAGVSQSYAAAAKDVKGLLLPAGDAWRAAWAADTALPLYGPDGFHPSPVGTYLAALVIYEQIFASPPPAGPVPAAAQPVAAVLRRVAHETLVALTSR